MGWLFTHYTNIKGIDMQCHCCGQEIKPSLSIEEYLSRAVPRLAAIDWLAKKIDFSITWELTPEGERYKQLMNEQMADEAAAGL